MNVDAIVSEIQKHVPETVNMPGTMQTILIHLKELNRLASIINDKSPNFVLSIDIVFNAVQLAQLHEE